MLLIVLALIGVAGLVGSVAIAVHARKNSDEDSKKGAVLVGVIGALCLLTAVINWIGARNWPEQYQAFYGFGFVILVGGIGWLVPNVSALLIVGARTSSQKRPDRRRQEDRKDAERAPRPRFRRRDDEEEPDEGRGR